ncbi:MAG: exodeoxyribonuclease VII large subunit [Comamonadaceae bacterium]|nr:MAG: exodeoxyribonuclease VII large subunit [Comamonadaceae bacterium]
MQSGLRQALAQRQQHLAHLTPRLPQALQRGLQSQSQRLAQAAMRLELLDPHLVLQRGYAWLSDAQGQAISSCQQTHAGQALTATLADGMVDLTVVNSIR